MLVFLFGVVFYFAIGSQANDNKAEFEVFLKKYNLTYDDAEYSRRFGIFTANLKRIENAKAGGAKGLGINRFADWDPEEFTQQYLLPLDIESKIPKKNRTSDDQAPDSRDIRAKRQNPPTSYDYRSLGWVTPVKNQGGCGSCWAHAAIAAQEVVHKRYNLKAYDLSEQMLVDCNRPPNSGCSGGWTDYALDYVMTKGVQFETSYPYTARDQSCYSPGGTIKGINYMYLSGENDISTYLYYNGPTAFYFRVPASFQWYSGGVFDVSDCTNNIIGLHEMLIVGYTPSYWIVKNSWGTGFGDQGYVYYARGKNLCGISNQMIMVFKCNPTYPNTCSA
ncbi:cathepsin L-like cysteine proteinase [Aphelenchoides avenae]|nr:cathepsin L-like cysteine proteinase [Aphelenchus avenae]